MIQTKAEEAKENKIRAELEELTRTIVQEDTVIENIQRKINKLPISRIKELK
jgi:urease gamma subunit